MNKKTEDKSQVSSVSSVEGVGTSQLGSSRFSLPSLEEMKSIAWGGLNFTVVAGMTCAAIVAVQSPVKTLLVNITKGSSMLPASSGGVFSVFKGLYVGTAASWTGSVIRTSYVTSTKPLSETMTKKVEMIARDEMVVRDEIKARSEVERTEVEKLESEKMTLAKFGILMGMTFGEILVTNYSESKSTLQKASPEVFTSSKINWRTPHNAYKLVAGGFAPRFATGMISFASMCELEGRIKNHLPIENKQLASFAAGAFSGMTAGFFAFPFALFKDHVQVQTTLVDGKLVNKSSISVAKGLFNSFKESPTASMKSFGQMALKQVPIRMGLTGAIFSIVAGVSATLGNHPLENFVSKENTAVAEPAPSKEVVAEAPKEVSAASSSHGFFNSKPKSERVAKETPSPEQATGPEHQSTQPKK